MPGLMFGLIDEETEILRASLEFHTENVIGENLIFHPIFMKCKKENLEPICLFFNKKRLAEETSHSYTLTREFFSSLKFDPTTCYLFYSKKTPERIYLYNYIFYATINYEEKICNLGYLVTENENDPDIELHTDEEEIFDEIF